MHACRSLLEGEWADSSADGRRLIQVACEYYLDAEDEEGDLESVHGFDDDAEVLNRVLDAVRRTDLKVRV